MHCTLLVPHLIWQQESAGGAHEDAALEPLKLLLARARATREAARPVEAWLCEVFGVTRQQDWPVAPLTLALDRGSTSDGYWLRADPVHLEMRREQIMLTEGARLQLASEETEAFIGTLNEHFSSDGLTFVAFHPERWYVRVSHEPRLSTHTLSEVAGRDVHEMLPHGTDAMAWHRIINETQMLLHSHATNAAREAADNMIINSLWFWGGGAPTRVRSKPYTAVWSNDPLASAFAMLSGTQSERVPADATAWSGVSMKNRRNGHHLVVLDTLKDAASYGDIAEWKKQLTELAFRWFAPLVGTLRQRQLERLIIAAPGEAACWLFEATPTSMLKLWRRPRSLQYYS